MNPSSQGGLSLRFSQREQPQKKQKKSDESKNFDNHRDVGRFQYLHDIRLVRASEAPGNENQFELAFVCRYPVFLGDCLVRVLFPSSGEPHRFPRKRRAVQLGPAQSIARSDYLDCLHGFHFFPVQGGEPALEPSGGFHMLDSGGLLCLQIAFSIL